MTALRQTVINKKGKANAFDLEVGLQLKQKRLALGLSQVALANKVNITFQQIQKYEAGTNRISASKIYEIAKALDVSVEYFFKTIDNHNYKKVANHPLKEDLNVIMSKRETLELVKAYYSIKNPQLRKKITSLMKNFIRIHENDS